MIWDMVEIAASAVENIIIVDFVGKYLGYKNQKIIWLKSGLFFVLSMMNVIVVPAVFHSEIVSAVILILLLLGYSIGESDASCNHQISVLYMYQIDYKDEKRKILFIIWQRMDFGDMYIPYHFNDWGNDV